MTVGGLARTVEVKIAGGSFSTTTQLDLRRRRAGVNDIPWVGLIWGLIAGGAAALLLWPMECLWLPSQPPQGPSCTSAIGVQSTWWLALATGAVLGVAAGWLALRVTRRNNG